MTIQIKGQKIKTYDGVALQPVEHMRSIGLCRRLLVVNGMRTPSLEDKLLLNIIMKILICNGARRRYDCKVGHSFQLLKTLVFYTQSLQWD